MQPFAIVTILGLWGSIASVIAAPVRYVQFFREFMDTRPDLRCVPSVLDLISDSEEDHHKGVALPKPTIPLHHGDEHAVPALRRRADGTRNQYNPSNDPPARRPKPLRGHANTHAPAPLAPASVHPASSSRRPPEPLFTSKQPIYVAPPDYWPRVIAEQITNNLDCPSLGSVPLVNFIAGIAHHTRHSDHVMAGALFFVADWVWRREHLPKPKKCRNGHLAFLVGLMLSAKTIEDISYTNKTWLSVARNELPFSKNPWLTLATLNRFEGDFLATIDYKVTLQLGQVLDDFKSNIEGGIPAIEAWAKAVVKYKKAT